MSGATTTSRGRPAQKQAAACTVTALFGRSRCRQQQHRAFVGKGVPAARAATLLRGPVGANAALARSVAIVGCAAQAPQAGSTALHKAHEHCRRGVVCTTRKRLQQLPWLMSV